MYRYKNIDIRIWKILKNLFEKVELFFRKLNIN